MVGVDLSTGTFSNRFGMQIALKFVKKIEKVVFTLSSMFCMKY